MLFISSMIPFILLTIACIFTLDKLYFMQFCFIAFSLTLMATWPNGGTSEYFILVLIAPTLLCIDVD